MGMAIADTGACGKGFDEANAGFKVKYRFYFCPCERGVGIGRDAELQESNANRVEIAVCCKAV